MVVTCPKCKVKLKVSDEKIPPHGSRYKCPKCTTVLLVKKPEKKAKKLDKNKVLIALNSKESLEKMSSLLQSEGFTVITSSDGVDTLVKATKELPFIAIVEVALAKIYGFEVCKRLKSHEETKEMKIMLFTTVFDKNKYKRQPSSLYGADDYLEDHEVQDRLLLKVKSLLSSAPPSEDTADRPQVKAPTVQKTGEVSATGGEDDEWTGKARRLVRTVLADIFLYNPQKAEDALRSGDFIHIFSSEINEGRKLYDSRIPKSVRDNKDLFEEELNSFIREKKRSMNI